MLGLLAVAAAAPAPADGQGAAVAVVRVRVTGNAAQAPMAGVSLVLLRAGEQALYAGITNDDGRYTFRVVPDSGASYRLVARKLGYVDTRRLVLVRGGDTLDFSLVIARLPQRLDTVRVNARALSSDYFVDSMAIMHSRRPIFDAYDAALKIHPNMLGDRQRGCDMIQYVWINGVRYPAEIRPFMGAAISHPGPKLRRNDGSQRSMPMDDGIPQRIDPESALARIRPQDIASMEYRNCWDTSIPGVGAENSLYIVLKPGIAFDWSRGSYPADSVPHP